jgi:hypothetical protein
MTAILISHTHADGTLLTGSHKGDGVLEIVSRHGFTWGRTVGIYIKNSRDKDGQQEKTDRAAQALRDADHVVTVQIDNRWRPTAVREAARTDRAEVRADRLDERAGLAATRAAGHQAAADRVHDSIPFGQPLLVDHYSYPADRNRRERASRSQEHAADERRYARDLADRADGVAANQKARHNPRVTMRRIDTLSAEVRQWERRRDDSLTSGGTGEKSQREVDRLAEEIRHWRKVLEELAASGEFVAGAPEDFAKGDWARVGGHGWYKVTRINPKSVSLASSSWPKTVKYDGVTGRRRDGMQWDTPASTPWSAALASKVDRWQQLWRRTGGRYDDASRQLARHVEWAQRLVHGLDLGAADVEVAVRQPAPGADVAATRALSAAYLDVYDRLEAGEPVPDIAASLTPVVGTPAWEFPPGDPEDIRVDRIEVGDIVKGVWDRGFNGRHLIRNFAGPVAYCSPVDRRGERGDWVTIRLDDGAEHEYPTHIWFAAWPTGGPR